MKKVSGLFLGLLLLVSCQQEKTAYVDNATLREGYEALKELNAKFEKQEEELQRSWQEDGEQFQKKVQEYQEKAPTMSKADEEKERNKLLGEQQSLQQKQQFQQSLYVQQRQNKHDSIQSLILDKVKDYAKAHNYSFVFGANENNNILYAQDGKDITQEVLKELNADQPVKDTATAE